jgi:hypothetical protein
MSDRLKLEKPEPVTVEIPADVKERLDAIPNRQIGPGEYQWEEWQIEVIKQYWNIKRQVDIADILGISPNTARKKAREMGLHD